jgi:hypothetical protein
MLVASRPKELPPGGCVLKAEYAMTHPVWLAA